jgi:hypothetical protein
MDLTVVDKDNQELGSYFFHGDPHVGDIFLLNGDYRQVIKRFWMNGNLYLITDQATW